MILLNDYPELKQELINHVENLKADGVLNEENKEDWINEAFNRDYYIIGRWNAKEWLKKHGIDPFEAIEHCITWEQEEFPARYFEPEHVVNLLTYTLAYQFMLH